MIRTRPPKGIDIHIEQGAPPSIRAEPPQAVAEVMRILNNGSLPLILDILRAHDQESHRARLRLALSAHNNRLPLRELPRPPILLIQPLPRPVLRPHRQHPARQAATSGREAGGHEGGAGEHEADGAAVDAHAGEGGGEAVHEAQVRQQRGRVLLEEERLAVQHVQRAAVGQLHGLEGPLLGQDLVHVAVQERVRRQQRLPEVPLHRRFELRLGRRLDPGGHRGRRVSSGCGGGFF